MVAARITVKNLQHFFQLFRQFFSRFLMYGNLRVVIMSDFCIVFIESSLFFKVFAERNFFCVAVEQTVFFSVGVVKLIKVKFTVCPAAAKGIDYGGGFGFLFVEQDIPGVIVSVYQPGSGNRLIEKIIEFSEGSFKN